MKRVLLSLLMLSGICANAQILSENFEGSTFPPTGWTRSSTIIARQWDLSINNFPGTTPESIALRNTFTINGNNSATIDWIDENNTANLVSPTFSLAGTSSPILKFNVVVGWSYMIDGDYGNLIAQISTNGGANWTTLWTEDTETGFTDDGDGDEDTDLYNTVAVQKDLSAYAGQTNVQIRFQYVANDADAVAIDDVQVLASDLATNEVSLKSKTNVYPNPTKGEINIGSDKTIKLSSVIDVSGKILMTSSSKIMDISNLPKGTYLMKIEYTDGSTTRGKVVKE